MITKGITAFQGVGQRMKQVRRSRNFSRRQMAAWLNLKESSYYKNENGENLPGWLTLSRLFNQMGISVDWLMLNHGTMLAKDKGVSVNQVEKDKTQQQEKLNKAGNALQEAQAELEGYRKLKSLLPEMDELMETMVNDPELRYDVLLNFHRYKKANPTPPQGKE